ncbi:MAG: extracellular solute-binding protein [Streptosporangiales bacterium]|nr:extracellular solute-binding protein [Streptosporangiales bacterium]
MTQRPQRSRRPRRAGTAIAASAAAVLVALTAACAPGSGGDAGNAKAPSSVSTDISKAGDVTLTVWDQEVRGGQNEQIEALNAAFQKKYPNVTIKRTSKEFTDLKTTLRLALSGQNPPDVVQANQGYGDMGAFVKAGMLVPLNKYADAYKWRDRYPKTLLALNSFTPDGKTFGSGELYGLSQAGEMVGVYYNKEKLSELGIQQPKTWADFEAALRKAKDAGELPIAFGNSDGFPAIHEYGVLQAQTAGKDAVRKLVFGQGGAWTDAPNTQAATTLKTWNDKGFLTKDANGVSYDDSWQDFADGEGVFVIAGTWLVPEFEKRGMGDKIGFMLPPPAQAGAASATTGGEGLPFAVTSKSKHPDVAAAYLNFLTSPEAMDVLVDNDVLPAVTPASKRPGGGLPGEVYAAWEASAKSDGLVPYLDYTTPSFYDTLSAELQRLLGGNASPEQVMQAAQKDYDDFTS